MTVIIGAICDSDYETQSGNIILCADRLLTWTDVNRTPLTSNDEGSKIYDLPAGFFVAISDNVSRCHQVYGYLHNRMKKLKITSEDPAIVDKTKLALSDAGEYIRLWIREEVLERHSISKKEWLQNKKLADRQAIEEEISKAVIDAYLIVAGFGANGVPVLFYTNCTGNPQEGLFPGFFCGGNGGLAALMWLNMRGQNASMSSQRTAYHISEAKRFAEWTPGVGPTRHMLLLSNGKAPVNISSLEPIVPLLSRFGPRDTRELDSKEAQDNFMGSYPANAP